MTPLLWVLAAVRAAVQRIITVLDYLDEPVEPLPRRVPGLSHPTCDLCLLPDREVFAEIAKSMPDLDALDKQVAGLYLIPEES